MWWYHGSITSSFQRLVLSVFGFMVTVLSLTNACPQNVIVGVYNCLRHVASSNTGRSAAHDVGILQSKCLDGSFDVTISCVNDLIHSCHDDEDKLNTIHRTVDVSSMQSAFKYTCENIHVQVESVTCVSKYKDEINRCCAGVEREFEREKNFAYTSELYLNLICRPHSVGYLSQSQDLHSNKAFGSGGAIAPSLMRRHCFSSPSFIDAITMCSERPVRLYCSRESAAVTVRLMSGLKPPGCLPYSSSTTKPSYSFHTSLVLPLTAIILKTILR